MKLAQCVTVLAVSLLAAGCAQTVDYRYVGTEALKNDQGHVVGHKDVLTDPKTGEQFEQLTHYQPLLDAKGEVYAYEESTRSGGVIRNLDGRRIGARYTDLRSRGTNPGSDGITITIMP